MRTRAAASSMASGRPSRRRQMATTSARHSRVQRETRFYGLRAFDEELHRRGGECVFQGEPASLPRGTGSGGMGNSRSARRRSGSRLVARIMSRGASSMSRPIRARHRRPAPVVEHQQGLAGSQVLAQLLPARARLVRPDARRAPWRSPQEQVPGPTQRREEYTRPRRERRPATRRRPARRGGSSRCLPGPVRVMSLDVGTDHHLAQRGELALAADQRRRLRRKVVRLRVETLQRWKLDRQSRSGRAGKCAPPRVGLAGGAGPDPEGVPSGSVVARVAPYP